MPLNVRILESVNPWWATGVLPARYANTIPRESLPALMRGLSPSRVTLVLGPRRVGKTVLLHQLVGLLLGTGIAPQNIVYLSADDPILGDPATLLPEVIEYLTSADETLSRSSNEPHESAPIYLLADEIHAVSDWQRLVKGYVDRGAPIVFVLSSSAGAALHKGARESLAGRAQDLALLPFSLAEFAAYRGSVAADLLRAAAAVWQDEGVGPVVERRAARLLAIDAESKGLGPELDRLTHGYLRLGGFPEYLSEEDTHRRTRYFAETVIERVIYQDVPAIAQIRSPFLMRELLSMLLSRGPGIINIARLSSDFGVSHITVAEYLRIIHVTMLNFILDRYASTPAGRQRGAKKSVPVDPGLVTALSGWDMQGQNARGYEGLLAEVVVHAWLRRHQSGFEILHWRESETKEVDFVIARPGALMPIEVKWRPQPRTRRLTGMDEFTRHYQPSFSLTVTRDSFELAAERARVPLWMLG